mmetsp:Transcript_18244/g.35611  ORF Transcript_18244/g.35611 Transcript_18244/m.35611 type:complete len:299 (+) Transcript_18244:250-1146(+)
MRRRSCVRRRRSWTLRRWHNLSMRSVSPRRRWASPRPSGQVQMTRAKKPTRVCLTQQRTLSAQHRRRSTTPTRGSESPTRPTSGPFPQPPRVSSPPSWSPPPARQSRIPAPAQPLGPAARQVGARRGVVMVARSPAPNYPAHLGRSTPRTACCLSVVLCQNRCLLSINWETVPAQKRKQRKETQSEEHQLLASCTTSSLTSLLSYWWASMLASSNKDGTLSSTTRYTAKYSECSPQITKSGESGFVSGSATSSTWLTRRSGSLPHPASAIDEAVPLLAHASIGTGTCSYRGGIKYVDD